MLECAIQVLRRSTGSSWLCNTGAVVVVNCNFPLCHPGVIAAVSCCFAILERVVAIVVSLSLQYWSGRSNCSSSLSAIQVPTFPLRVSDHVPTLASEIKVGTCGLGPICSCGHVPTFRLPPYTDDHRCFE